MAETHCYLVTAYRWGWTNNGFYHVGCWLSRDTAIAFAKAECSDRGGKYGVAVFEFTGEEEKLVHYSPSAYGEIRPHMNYRIALFDQFGNQVVPELKGEIGDAARWTVAEMQKLIAHEEAVQNIFRDADLRANGPTHPQRESVDG